MRCLLIFIFFLISCATIVSAQTQHNDVNEDAWVSAINQNNRANGIYRTCDISQSGRAKATERGVIPPTEWRLRCANDLRVSWAAVTNLASGAPVTGYIVSYRRMLSDNAGVVEVRTGGTFVVLNIAEAWAYQIRVEASDENGNTDYIEDVSYE